MKKLLSLILALTLVLGLFGALTLNASAEDGQDGIWYYSVLDNGTASIGGCEEPVGDLVVPEKVDGYTVTRLSWGAFLREEGITSVTLPDTINELGDRVFTGCTNLKSVNLPEGITEIPDTTFDSCVSLEEIDLPSTLTTIGISAFYGCKSLKFINLPDGLAKIGNGAFEDCSSLTAVTIPRVGEMGLGMGWGVFMDCSSLSTVMFKVGSQCTTEMFTRCTSLKDILVEEGHTGLVVKDGVLYNSSMTSLMLYPAQLAATTYTLPDSVNYINSDFNSCVNLTEFIVGEANEKFSAIDGVLYNKDGSNLVAYPAAKESAEYVIPEGVTGINPYTFSGAKNLTCVTIPDSVSWCYAGTFYGATALEEIEVDEANENFVSVDGVLFRKDMSELIAYPAAKAGTEYTIPEEVNRVTDYAFKAAANLSDVYAPNKYTSFGFWVFEDSGVTLHGYYNSNAEVHAGSYGVPFEPIIDAIAGDVDGSANVDVGDIMKLKALIMADRWSDDELAVGDMNKSLKLDVGDIMEIKNVIMSK